MIHKVVTMNTVYLLLHVVIEFHDGVEVALEPPFLHALLSKALLQLTHLS